MKNVLRNAAFALALTFAATAHAEEPKLTVRLIASAPHGAVVVLDGVVLPPTDLGVARPIAPGRHEVRVEAMERAPRTFVVTLAENEQKVLDVSPGAGAFRSNGAGPLAAAHDEDDSEHTLDFSQRVVGTSLAGVGLAGLGFGSIFGIVSLSTSDAEESRNAGQIATGFLIGGAIATVAGAIIYLTGSPSSSR